MKTKISELRDKLYESLPTGDVDTFELIKLIKEHIKELDKLDKKFISKEQAKKGLEEKFKQWLKGRDGDLLFINDLIGKVLG